MQLSYDPHVVKARPSFPCATHAVTQQPTNTLPPLSRAPPSPHRDFISWGYKPHLEVLDKLLACLRLQLPKAPQRPAELQQRALQLQAQLQALPHPDAPAHMGTASPAAASPSSAGGSSDAPDGQAASASSSRVARQQQQQEQPGQWLQTAALLKDLASQRHAQSPDERPYEVPFDKRAIDAVADAISMGLLPALKVGCMLRSTL